MDARLATEYGRALTHLLRLLPRRRGATIALAALARMLPLLNRAAVIVDGVRIELDLSDRNQAATLIHGMWRYPEVATFCGLLKPGDVVFDIGANWGFYVALASARVGPTGRIFAVEPSGAVRQLRQLAARLGNITVIQGAIGDMNGTAALKRSWLQPTTASFMVTGGQIAVATLDTLWKSCGTPPAAVLKVDTEGAEPLVLGGGRMFLSQPSLRHVLVEISSYTRRFSREPDEVYTRLADAGFVPVADANTARAATPGTFGNILFARRNR